MKKSLIGLMVFGFMMIASHIPAFATCPCTSGLWQNTGYAMPVATYSLNRACNTCNPCRTFAMPCPVKLPACPCPAAPVCAPACPTPCQACPVAVPVCPSCNTCNPCDQFNYGGIIRHY